jgi:hypothetical protein
VNQQGRQAGTPQQGPSHRSPDAAQGLACSAGLQVRQGASEVGRMERLRGQQRPDHLGHRPQAVTPEAAKEGLEQISQQMADYRIGGPHAADP